MDIYAEQAAFKQALFTAEQQLKPLGWRIYFVPIVVRCHCTGELMTWPFGMVLKRGRREVVVTLTVNHNPWARSLN